MHRYDSIMSVLVVDVGGSHVKLACSDISESRRFDSGPELTPEKLLSSIREMTSDWNYQTVSLGIPGRVGPDGPTDEPGNLAPGWVGFNFQEQFQRPTRIINDAVMQGLGAYEGGRMLFLGLGTGLGSTLIVDRVVVPLELGAIHDICGTDWEYLGVVLGKKNMERIGEAEWKQKAIDAIRMLKDACLADYIVLGGGHAELIDPLPRGVRRGGNDDAFRGGFRLWEENIKPHDVPTSAAFRVVF